MENHLLRPTLLPADATPRHRLIPRVYAERPGTSFEAVSYRVRKALMAGDQAAAAEAYRLLDPDQRDAFQKSLDDTVTKGFWNAKTRRYDLPDGQWSAAHPRPEQRPEPAPAKPRLELAPQIGGSGFLHEIRRGSIFHADIEGERVHFKAHRWGRTGITGIDREGRVAKVAWSDVKWGVAPESAAEHVAKSWRPPLYAMDPAERAQYFAARDGADFQNHRSPEHVAGFPATSLKPTRWQKLWQRIS